MNYADIALGFLGALGLFIFGIYVLSAGLRKAAGDKMKKVLERLSKKRWQGVIFGAGVTAVIQSSTATTVTAIGFVNAGIMELGQVVGIIFGANIGTVTTSWLIAVTDWFVFLRPEFIGAVCAAMGAVMLLFAKKKKRKNLGEIIMGFGVLFMGLTLMTDAVRPLRDLEAFQQLFASLGANPALGILAGIIVTAMIQSSTASIGILQGMAAAGILMPWNAAVYIIMGLNIGTTITAVMSSIGASRNARAAAYIHLIYNVLSVAIFIVPTVIFFTLINPALSGTAISSAAISGVHTVFNIASLVVLYPFANFLVLAALKMTGKDGNGGGGPDAVHLDDRVLNTPSFALEISEKEIDRLAAMTLDNLTLALDCFFDKDKDTEPVRAQEDNIDKLEAAIAAYLVKVSSENLSKSEIDTVASLFHVLTDIERIADHAENIAELADIMREADLPDIDSAVAELQNIRDVTLACYVDAVTALKNKDKELANVAVREEDSVDELERAYRSAHINKMSSGEYSLRSGVIFLDMLNNLERITDHARNIAEVVLKQ